MQKYRMDLFKLEDEYTKQLLYWLSIGDTLGKMVSDDVRDKKENEYTFLKSRSKFREIIQQKGNLVEFAEKEKLKVLDLKVKDLSGEYIRLVIDREDDIENMIDIPPKAMKTFLLRDHDTKCKMLTNISDNFLINATKFVSESFGDF